MDAAKVVVPFSSPRILPDGSRTERLRSQHGARLAHYQELRDFYEGRHFVGRRAGRTQLVANYARAIVDKHVAYTFARGVLIEGVEVRGSVPASLTHASLEETLDRILEGTAFPRVLLQAATNASVLGDAVLKVVWTGGRPLTRLRSARRRTVGRPLPRGERREGLVPSPLAGEGCAVAWGAAEGASSEIRVVNVDPARFFPTFASDDPTCLREVAVISTITPDEARDRYGLALSRPADLVETWTTQTFVVQVAGRPVVHAENPYGFIPYVHLPNLAPPGSAFGISDLEDVIPLNRELDERLSDQADLIRYHADPPVIFKGVRDHSDLAVGPGTVWDIPDTADVSLLEWRGQLPALDSHLSRVLRAIYDVSEAPQSSFGDTSAAFSGVALETQLQPIVQRTLRRRITWEPALRTIARYALQLYERFELEAPGAFAPYPVRIHWLPMLPRDDDAEANRYIALTAAGLRSHTGAMEALGLPDPPAELERVRSERAALEAGPHA